MIIRDGLLGYLVGRLIREGSGEYEDDLVLCGAAPQEDVLQHARQPHFRQRLPDLLPELAAHRVPRVLAELDMTAKGPVKQLTGRVRLLRHQQRAVAWPPDQHHRLDDLASGVHRYFVSHRAGAAAKPAGRRTV